MFPVMPSRKTSESSPAELDSFTAQEIDRIFPMGRAGMVAEAQSVLDDLSRRLGPGAGEHHCLKYALKLECSQGLSYCIRELLGRSLIYGITITDPYITRLRILYFASRFNRREFAIKDAARGGWWRIDPSLAVIAEERDKVIRGMSGEHVA